MKKIILIGTQKGGVGKTSTACQVAAILNRLEYKTLLIDADPQKNTTSTYRGKIEGEATLTDVLAGSFRPHTQLKLNEAIQHTEFADLVPADQALTAAIPYLLSQPDGYLTLKHAITKDIYDTYDYIVIDSNPTINILLMNCMAVASDIIIPCTPDYYAADGLVAFYDAYKTIKKSFNRDLNITGILITMYEGGRVLTGVMQDVLQKISEELDTPVFETVIRRCSKIKESQAKRMPLIEYAPSCTTERDYEAFVNLILEMGGEMTWEE